MRFIKDQAKLAKINEMANAGDEAAKDFLFRFMEMDEEEANAYLASVSVEGNGTEEETQTQEGWKSVIEFLIKDENEAIDGYDKAMKFVAASDLPELVKTAYLERLQHIKDEELEHIKELKEIL